jgi:hypothetical protein
MQFTYINIIIICINKLLFRENQGINERSKAEIGNPSITLSKSIVLR